MTTHRKIIFILLMLSIASGLVDGYYAHLARITPGPANLLFAFLFTAAAFAWYYFDAKARSYHRRKLLDIAVIVLNIIAIPYYLIRSREKGHRLKSVALFFLLFIFLLGLSNLFANIFLRVLQLRQ